MRCLRAWLLIVCTMLGLSAEPVDETRSLQALIDAVPAGGVLQLEARVYRAQDLRINRSITIRGRGHAVTVWRRDLPRPFFRVRGKATVATFEDLAMDGGGLQAAGIEALGIRHLRLKGLHVARCGVPNPVSLPSDRFGKPVDGVYAKDVDEADVEACTFVDNGRDGFIGIPVRHLRFIGNFARGNGRMGATSDLDPERRAGGPLSVIYRNNEVVDCGTGGLHVESDKGYPVTEALFEGNRIVDCGNRDWGYSWGLTIGNHAKGVMRNNVIEGTGARGKLKAYRNGIHLDLLGGPVRVENNIIKGSGRMGIAITRSPFPVQVVGNRVDDSGIHGIAAYEVEGLAVKDTTVRGANESALWIRLCPQADVTGNRFERNSRAKEGEFAAFRAERSFGLKVLDNDLGGWPQRTGFDLEAAPFGTPITFKGNRFEGKRMHPLLSTFKTEN